MLITQLLAQALPNCNPGSGTLNLTECYRLNDTQSVGDVYSQPAFLVNLLVRNVFVVSGVIFFIIILYAGFLYISNPDKGADQARDVLTTAAIGFIIMFAAFWIVQIVRVVTGADIVL